MQTLQDIASSVLSSLRQAWSWSGRRMIFAAAALLALAVCVALSVLELTAGGKIIHLLLSVFAFVLAAAETMWLVQSYANQAVQAEDILQTKTDSERLAQQAQSTSQELTAANNVFTAFHELLQRLGAASGSVEAFDLMRRTLAGFSIPFTNFVVFEREPKLRAVYKFIGDKHSREVLEMSSLSGQSEPLVNECLANGCAVWSAEASVYRHKDISDSRIFSSDNCVVCTPLLDGRRVFGVIYIGCSEPDVYSEKTFQLLSVLTSSVSALVYSIMCKEETEYQLEAERSVRMEIEQQKKQLEGLQEMVRQLGSEMRSDFTVQVLIKFIHMLVPSAQAAAVFISDVMISDSAGTAVEPEKKPSDGDAGIGVKFVASACYPEDFSANIADVQLGDSFLGQVMEIGRRIVVEDFSQYAYKNIVAAHKSAIGVPLRVESENLGCLYVGSSEVSAFSDSEINAIQILAGQASLAVKNAFLLEHMRNLAITDGLTGLYTHRYFKENLYIQVRRAAEEHGSLCLVMFDADHFKQYNDTLGHPAGDSLLRRFSAIIKDSVRSDDIVCRQGGDEFSAILLDCSKERGINLAKSIRSRIEEAFSTDPVQVTSSIGLACFPTDAQSTAALLKSADSALYRSKQGGRNMVSHA